MDQNNDNTTTQPVSTTPTSQSVMPQTPTTPSPEVKPEAPVMPVAPTPEVAAPAPTIAANTMSANPMPTSTPNDVVPPVVPPTQAPNNPQDPGYAQTKSHTMMFVMIGIIILVLVSLVVLFFYRQFTTITSPSSKVTPSPVVAAEPTAVPVSPTVTPANTEEKELQGIDNGEVDTQLSNIKKDISDL